MSTTGSASRGDRSGRLPRGQRTGQEGRLVVVGAFVAIAVAGVAGYGPVARVERVEADRAFILVGGAVAVRVLPLGGDRSTAGLMTASVALACPGAAARAVGDWRRGRGAVVSWSPILVRAPVVFGRSPDGIADRRPDGAR